MNLLPNSRSSQLVVTFFSKVQVDSLISTLDQICVPFSVCACPLAVVLKE